MAVNRKTDSDHMVVVPHTPREDAIRRDYETWLRDVDNPMFNRMPGVVRAATPALPTKTPISTVICISVDAEIWEVTMRIVGDARKAVKETV